MAADTYERKSRRDARRAAAKARLTGGTSDTADHSDETPLPTIYIPPPTQTAATECGRCGNPLPPRQNPGAPARRWCSDDCRRLAKNDRRRIGPRPGD